MSYVLIWGEDIRALQQYRNSYNIVNLPHGIDSATKKSHLHRDSQRRIYEEGAEYFITTATEKRYPYFANPILAELFIRDLWFAKVLKQFHLFGYTVMPDHVHLLFQSRGKANYSEIMRSIKTNFSRDANDIVLNRVNRFPVASAGDVAPRRLLRDQSTSNTIASHRLRKNAIENTNGLVPCRSEDFQQHYLNVVKPLHNRFITKYSANHDIPRFEWQSSFRDHVIRDENDYLNHLEYIYGNAVKHGLVGEPEQYPFMWIIGMLEPSKPD